MRKELTIDLNDVELARGTTERRGWHDDEGCADKPRCARRTETDEPAVSGGAAWPGWTDLNCVTAAPAVAAASSCETRLRAAWPVFCGNRD